MLNRKKILSIVLTTLLAISLTAVFLAPNTNAHTPPWTVQTYAYVTATPNPYGLGSANPVLIVFWINNIPPTAAGNAGARWLDMTIDITGPTGQVEHFGPFTSDPVGGAYMPYTPTETGNYQVNFTFPTQNATLNGGTGITAPGTPSALVGDIYLGSTATTNFTVNQTPTSYFEEAPIPVSYWTRPINENNQNWAQIGSAWLGQQEYGATYSKYNPTGRGPNTAHVSQTIPLSWGGIVGGDNAQVPRLASTQVHNIN